ncbi:glycosyl transferase [Sulfodiicoccus acidiphilus]|uniref:Glycosyl transferase n=2 Tax=Sulfodiicoccus acidiphilus TaxID=1670455 RepID=A0A348B5Q5_9CREN|nr:glycosyl transferase [Sulfodiicoccus acidiphilus]GGT92655.1 glycosyl transferase [Sulfodiicoccus acidiphilus]
MGVEVHWLSEDFGGKREEELRGIHVVRRGNSLTLHLHSLLLARHYDVVLDSVAHAVPFLSNLTNPRTVAKVHHVHQEVLAYELPPYKAWPVRTAEKFCRLYSRVVVPSNATKEDAEKLLGVREEAITVIPDGIDHSKFTPGEKGEPLVVWLHRLKRYKNPLDAIKAYRRAREMGLRARLVVAGGGDLEREVREEVGRTEGATYLGRVSDEEKRVLLRRAWLFLSTSFVEGWGLSVLEANASGTPALVYSVGSLKELVKDGVNGVKVSYGDVEGLARAMIHLFEDEVNLRRMWATSKEESLKYDWDITAERYYNYLKGLA